MTTPSQALLITLAAITAVLLLLYYHRRSKRSGDETSRPAVAETLQAPSPPEFVVIPGRKALSLVGLCKVIEMLTYTKVIDVLRQDTTEDSGKRVNTLDAMLFNNDTSQLKAQRVVVVEAAGKAYLGAPLRDVSPTSGSFESRLEYGADGAGTSLILDDAASARSAAPALELAPVLALHPNDTPRFYPFSEPRSYGFSGETGDGATAPPIDYSVIGSLEPLPRDRLHNTLAQESSMLNMMFR